MKIHTHLYICRLSHASFIRIKESTEIRDTIYPEDANDMSYDYVYDFLPVAKTRLQQAGVRIAAYLNNVFANTK